MHTNASSWPFRELQRDMTRMTSHHVTGSRAKPETGYRVKQAFTRTEMDKILDVIWAANHTPYEPLVQLFFPVLGYLPSDREAASIESKERFWSHHSANEPSNWFYVEDTVTSEVLGCAQWELHLENPFKNGPPLLEAPWWPVGEYRDFCESVLAQVYKPRATWMTRPHIALNWMAVHPHHRRLGVGTLLMKAGVALADAHKVEAWMEASAMGKPLYEHHGFRSLLKMCYDMERPNASDTWKRCVHELTPTPFFLMWRPRGGIWESSPGATRLPWQLGSFEQTDGDEIAS